MPYDLPDEKLVHNCYVEKISKKTEDVNNDVMFNINQMIISKNPQFTGISARQQLEFTTHLLLTD